MIRFETDVSNKSLKANCCHENNTHLVTDYHFSGTKPQKGNRSITVEGKQAQATQRIPLLSIRMPPPFRIAEYAAIFRRNRRRKRGQSADDAENRQVALC